MDPAAADAHLRGMKFDSSEKQLLAKGSGVAIGEWIFGIEGAFLFSRFGLSPPVAAAVGTMLGAALGYEAANFLVHTRRRPPVEPPASREARERIERALSRLAERESLGLHVEIRSAKVILTGTVYSRAADEEAEHIVRDLAGTRDVENRLDVVS